MKTNFATEAQRTQRTELDDNSAERLWKMFFPHLIRAAGMEAVRTLYRLHISGPLCPLCLCGKTSL